MSSAIPNHIINKTAVLSSASCPSVENITECRLCGSKHLKNVLSLTPTPPANNLVDAAEVTDIVEEVYPLDLQICMECCHLQLSHAVDPKLLFKHYLYTSSAAPAMVQHLHDYAKFVIPKLNLNSDRDFIVEIGSNDGTMLRHFRNAGFQNILGIDPAENLAKKATEQGLETWPKFFNAETAREIRATRGCADLVIANHVFAHCADMAGFIEGVRHILSERGVFVFEVGYFVDVFQKSTFDTVYHEHLDYHRVQPLRKFFKKHGLRLFDVQRSDIQGGSLRGYVCHDSMATSNCEMFVVSDQVLVLEQLESDMQLNNPDTYLLFRQKIDTVKDSLLYLLRELRDEGKIVAAYGIPAKATTMMYEFGLDNSVIQYIIDDSPYKIGKYSPGLHIPIVSSKVLYETNTNTPRDITTATEDIKGVATNNASIPPKYRRPDYLVILAWNFAEPIMTTHEKFKQNGGRFIVPFPNVLVH